MNRGILVTAYANLKEKVDYDTVRTAYDKYYAMRDLSESSTRMYVLRQDGLRAATMWMSTLR